MMRKCGVMLVTALLGSACATEAAYTQNVRSWVGKSQGNLIYVWGEPTRIEDADGTRTIVYETSRTSEEYARVTAKPGAHLDGPLRCTTTFYLEQGVVTRFAFEGNDCKVK